MSHPYQLKLENFEGPLDLLLHLIRSNEIDIFKIDIVFLTSQYVSYLRVIKFDDLQQAGDFLAMAATLIELKSRYLLPRQETANGEGDGLDDPLLDLQQRLLEYEKYKTAGQLFAQLAQANESIHTSAESKRLEKVYEDVEAPLRGDSHTLLILYEQLLSTMPYRKKHRIEAKMHLVSVEEKIKELEALMKSLDFALFQGFYASFGSRYEMVVYILAILEMVRWNALKIYQTEILGPIWIYRVDLEEENLPLRASHVQASRPEQEV